MKIKLDMHVHSEKSFDSRQAIEAIACECKRKGLDGVCICDHDVSHIGITLVDGVLVLGGVELSTEYGHLLGHLLEADVEPTRDFHKALERIRTANGIAVLAHPFERVRDARETVDARIDETAALLDGIEVENARGAQFVPQANEYAREAAKRVGARTFAGSDAHLTCEVGNAYIELELDAERVEDITREMLCDALKHGHMTAHMARRSARLNTAKSQFIRMKKTHAGAKRWCRYFVYAAKCCVYDLIYYKKEKKNVSDR